MIKKLIFIAFMLVCISVQAANKPISLFGFQVEGVKYKHGQWLGPMPNSNTPSLDELGVQRFDNVTVSLNTEDFRSLLSEAGFIPRGKSGKRTPILLSLYSDQIIMDSDFPYLDHDLIAGASLYTVNTRDYGVFTHFFYEIKNGKFKNVKDLTFNTIDSPECSTVNEFALYWLNGSEAPVTATVINIVDSEINPTIITIDKNLGDYRKILKKVKLLPSKNIKPNKRKCSNCKKNSLIESEPVIMTSYCGNSSSCERGTNACDIRNGAVCKADDGGGDGGGGSGWGNIILFSLNTILYDRITDNIVKKFWFFQFKIHCRSKRTS